VRRDVKGGNHFGCGGETKKNGGPNDEEFDGAKRFVGERHVGKGQRAGSIVRWEAGGGGKATILGSLSQDII